MRRPLERKHRPRDNLPDSMLSHFYTGTPTPCYHTFYFVFSYFFSFFFFLFFFFFFSFQKKTEKNFFFSPHKKEEDEEEKRGGRGLMSRGKETGALLLSGGPFRSAFEFRCATSNERNPLFLLPVSLLSFLFRFRVFFSLVRSVSSFLAKTKLTKKYAD